MAEPQQQPGPYGPTPIRELAELVRRPGMLLMLLILWPSAIVGTVGAWALHLLHQHVDALVTQCGPGG